MKNKPLVPIFLIVFVDLLGFGIIVPLLPRYADSFGASDTVIGLLLASSSVMQLNGAPIWGGWVLGQLGAQAPALSASIVLLAALVYAAIILRSSIHLPQPQSLTVLSRNVEF